jgi:polyphosphate kinase
MVSNVYSLMMYNERVLTAGEIDDNREYSIDEMLDKVFFNKIFLSNTKELFQKYDCDEINEDYTEDIIQYNENILNIIKRLPFYGIDLKPICFESKLMTERILDDIISFTRCTIDSIDRYRFVDRIKYYITYINDNNIVVSSIDPRSVMYKSPLCSDSILWRTADSIINYINRQLNVTNTIMIDVTTNIEMVKIEAYGPVDMNILNKIFSEDILIVCNQQLYVDDIEQMLSKRAPILGEFQKPNKIDISDIFDHDVLTQFPYSPFNDYLDILRSVCNDNTKSISLSLYRLGDRADLYYVLKEAINNGIEVNVNIELFASGENINKLWRNEMSNIGINVTTYGGRELKVHAKLTLIEFKDGRSICQIGTGNYHPITTRQYIDISLWTSDLDICRQTKLIFDIFNGNSEVKFNDNFLVTKHNMRRELVRLINREAHENGYICIKCNALNDYEIIGALEAASDKGCRIDLIIRGVCAWIPTHLHKLVRIKSVIWDKLEHSRVYIFGKVNPDIYIGSLDLVRKKIDKRIEVLSRVNDVDAQFELIEYMNAYITYTDNSWTLLASGFYRRG